jgi:DNA-directed RNA polymerase specialized sigma24 family protein
MELCAGDTDIDLVAASRRDDLDAAEQLVERYGERVCRLAWRITGAADDAEVATQNALLTAARSNPGSIGPWPARPPCGAGGGIVATRRRWTPS